MAVVAAEAGGAVKQREAAGVEAGLSATEMAPATGTSRVTGRVQAKGKGCLLE